MINFLVDKTEHMDIGTGAIYSIVAILMVFLILLIIIGITTLVFKLTGLFELKKELDASKKQNNNVPQVSSTNNEVSIKDDDMMAAVLVATIDYRKEINKDVRVVNVKEVK